MAAVSVGVSAKRGDRDTLKMRPAVPQQAFSPPLALRFYPWGSLVPRFIFMKECFPPRKWAWCWAWGMVDREACSSQTGGHNLLQGAGGRGCSPWPFPSASQPCEAIANSLRHYWWLPRLSPALGTTTGSPEVQAKFTQIQGG